MRRGGTPPKVGVGSCIERRCGMAPGTGALAEAPAVAVALAPAREDSLACTFRFGDLLVFRRPSPMVCRSLGMLAVEGLCGEAGGSGAPHTAVAALGLCRDWCRQALTATEPGCIGELGTAADKPKEALGSDMAGERGADRDAAAAASLSETPLGSTGVTVGALVFGAAVADAPCIHPRR